MDQEQNNVAAVACRMGEPEMFGLIEKQQQMKVSVRAFCAERHISHSRLYYWLRKYRSRPSVAPAPSGFTLLNVEPEHPHPFCELLTRRAAACASSSPWGLRF